MSTPTEKDDIARFVAKHRIDGDESGVQLNEAVASDINARAYQSLVDKANEPPSDDEYERLRRSINDHLAREQDDPFLNEPGDDVNEDVVEHVSIAGGTDFSEYLEVTELDTLSVSSLDESGVSLNLEDAPEIERFNEQRSDVNSGLKNLDWKRIGPIGVFVLVMIVFVMPLTTSFTPAQNARSTTPSVTAPASNPDSAPRSFAEYEQTQAATTAASEDELINNLAALNQLTTAISEDAPLPRDQFISASGAEAHRAAQSAQNSIKSVDEARVQRALEDAATAKRNLEAALAREADAVATVDLLNARVHELKSQERSDNALESNNPVPSNVNGYVLHRETLASPAVDARWRARSQAYQQAQQPRERRLVSDPSPRPDGLTLTAITEGHAIVHLKDCRALTVARGMSLPGFGRITRIDETSLHSDRGAQLSIRPSACAQAPSGTEPILALPLLGG